MRFIAFLATAASTVLAQPVTQLDPWAADSIRVRIAPPGATIWDPPLRGLLPSPPTQRATTSFGSGSTLTNGNLRVDIDPATGYLTATRVSDGALLLKQTGLAFGTPDVPVTREGSVSASIVFAGTVGERIYGLGEHRTGVVNQMPFAKRFADSQDYAKSGGSNVMVPFYASSLGYGFLWNNAAYGSASLNETALEWYANATLGVDVWITTTSAGFDPASGRSPHADILANYVDAVGHASQMPYYATSFIQCKDRYRNQSQLLDVARGYVERQLPLSVVVIDWKHWTSQGDWHFNPQCWPDPQGMFDELQTMGIELMVTFWPFQSLESRHWQNFSSNGWLVNKINATSPTSYDGGDQYLIDETNADARAAVFDGFMEQYGSIGIKTIWIDAAEPEHFGGENEGQWKLLQGTDAEVGEAWVQQHARVFADGFATRGITPDEYFILPRSAWVGSWRHSAALWSGDIVSTFDELALQVKVLQGVMMSGVALWTSDIGGYRGGNPEDPVFQELITRWFQFGAFCPLFRLHGHRDGGPEENECGATNGDNEVWNLAGGEETLNYKGIVSVMRIREGLRQYVSEANQEHAATGFPMVRPMFLQFPLDPGSQGADVEDQYMFGAQYLVAPVYTQGAASRSVYLPLLNATTEWVYYFNFSGIGRGGGRVDVATPIDEFPLFFMRPITPPTPVATTPVTSLYSSERLDSVFCATDDCVTQNSPGEPGNYTPLRVEGYTVVGSDPVVINGTTYNKVPLYLFFSYTRNDNLVSTNATPPDSTYIVAEAGGDAFAAPAPPGSTQLAYFFKQNNATTWDYATVASDAGKAWALQNGYTDVSSLFPTIAFILTNPIQN